MQRNDLKKEIIKLLKEDEEFKYTVAGLIGYDKILKSLDEHTKRFEEHDRKFNEIIGEIKDIKKIQDEHTKRFEEHDRKFNEIINRLDAHDRKFNEIIGEIKEIKKVQDEHTRILDEHTRILDEHTRILDEHTRILDEHDRKLTELKIGLGSLGLRLGKGLEKLILNLYKDRLLELGVDPSKARRYEFIDYDGKYGLKGKRYEFDIVITDNYVDIIEVKSHIEEYDIVSFYEKVNSIRELLLREFNNINRLIAVAVHINEDALLRAEELDIKCVYGAVIPPLREDYQ